MSQFLDAVISSNIDPETYVLTLSLKSLSGHSSVCYKTSLNTGGVGQAGAAPPTSKLEKFLSWPLALSMSIYSNFQINVASGETLKPPDSLFCFKNRGSRGVRVSPKVPFIWKWKDFLETVYAVY